MPKYESLRKTARNKQLYEYYLQHKDDMSVRDIGKIFGVSGARVCQIVKDMRNK